LKITAVEPVVLRVDLAEPVRISFGRIDRRYAILVRIDTDVGPSGWGESWSNFPAWSPYERVHTIREGLASLLLGEDPRQVLWLHEKLRRQTDKLARQWGAIGPVSHAISAVDIALWDLLGKETGLPLYQLWGGAAQLRVPVYASGLGPGDPQPLAEPLRRRGVDAFKLKIGFGQDTDQQNLARLRQRIGPDALLLTDANQAWDLRSALQMTPMLEEFGTYWLEEPLPADQIADLARLRRSVPFRIAAGENVYGREGFRHLLDQEAVDVIQPDVCKTGGLTEARAICSAAAGRGIPYAPHYFGSAVGLVASLHLFAATPGGFMMELDANPNPLRAELGGEAVRVEAGCLAVPTGPGLGFVPDPRIIERYRVRIMPQLDHKEVT
jgi:L-alanine-DL-glutamate epimerase-like enolase superfamily enzyme